MQYLNNKHNDYEDEKTNNFGLCLNKKKKDLISLFTECNCMK